jgi:hypothetical protein
MYLCKNLSLGSDEYLKKIKQDQPYVLKSIEHLLSDKIKLANIGSPIKLIKHEIYDKNNFLNVSFFFILRFICAI